MATERGKARRPDQLPPGRHGLPPEIVAESQRRRMLAAALETVAEKGYQDTRVTDIIARAGVSRKTFYEHFDEKEECFFAAYDRELAGLLETTSRAFAGEGRRPWPDRVRDAVRAMLGYLAEHPAAARVCIVDAMGAGHRAIARRDAALRDFTYFVDAGRGEAGHEVPGRVALAVLGGVNELIANELTHGSPDKIEELAPEIVYMITLPFLGPEAALAERTRTRRELESLPDPAQDPGSAQGPGPAND